MTKYQFKINLIEALECCETYATNDMLDHFIELNFKENSYIQDWTFMNFYYFAIDVANEGMKKACQLNDLLYELDE